MTATSLPAHVARMTPTHYGAVGSCSCGWSSLDVSQPGITHVAQDAALAHVNEKRNR